MTLTRGRESSDSKASKEYKDVPAYDTKSLSQSVSSLDREDDETTTQRQEQEMKAELVAWEQEERDRALVDQREKSTPEKVRIINFKRKRKVFSLHSFSAKMNTFFIMILGDGCCKSCRIFSK